VKVSHSAVRMFLRRDGLRFKKTLFALEQARAGRGIGLAWIFRSTKALVAKSSARSTAVDRPG